MTIQPYFVISWVDNSFLLALVKAIFCLGGQEIQLDRFT